MRKNLEDSQSDLLNRVTEMEKIVERENHEMKMLSGDCMKLKRELLETSSRYDEEYQTRVKLETYVDKLRSDTGYIIIEISLIHKLSFLLSK